MARLKQQQIPGTEPPSIKELDKAADAFVEVRDERMALSKTESDARGVVEQLMEKHKLAEYVYDGRVIKMSIKKKATVRKVKDGDDDDEDEDEDEED